MSIPFERRIAICLVGWAAFGGCADSVRSNSSETHFLAICEPGACPDGQTCLCGVCSVACSDDGACASLAEEVECLEPADATCETAAVCDVTCGDDEECNAVGGEYRCEAGRCRAVTGVTEPPADGVCTYFGATHADGATFAAVDGCNTCTCDGGEVGCTEIGCMFDGVPLRACDYQGTTHADGTRFPEDDGCNECMCNDGEVSCTTRACDTVDEPPCDTGSCDFYGVCYPDGATTEDGCCTCGGGCIEPGWCPGRPDIGSRCGGPDSGCAMGLECRTDFIFERAVCTRPCNYGCPTGTECVAEVPDYNGGVVRDMCLRTCETQADCDFPLGLGTASECDMPPGVARRYCF